MYLDMTWNRLRDNRSRSHREGRQELEGESAYDDGDRGPKQAAMSSIDDDQTRSASGNREENDRNNTEYQRPCGITDACIAASELKDGHEGNRVKKRCERGQQCEGDVLRTDQGA
jgi:hypothetical protein